MRHAHVISLSMYCLLSLLLYASTLVDATSVRLQPWAAAKAALTTFSDLAFLRHVDEDTLKVACGHKLELGLEVEGKLYKVAVGNQTDWRKMELPKLTDGGHQISEGSMTEVTVDACTLPEITLTGPLEIEWTHPSRALLMMPPEPYTLHRVNRLKLADGARISITGLNDLQLKEPLGLTGLMSEYADNVHGEQSADGLFKGERLMNIAQSIRERTVREGSYTVRLQAKSDAGVTLHQLHDHPVNVFEQSPGILTVIPRKDQWMPKGTIENIWMWPLPGVSPSDLVVYETLLHHILSQHGTQLNPKTTSIKLHLHSQAATWMHLEMEVRLPSGPTQMIEAQLLINDTDDYIPLNTQPIRMEQYTTTISKAAMYERAGLTFPHPETKLYDMYL